MARTPTDTDAKVVTADELKAANKRVAGLGEVDTTQPLDQRPHGAAIVKADTNGRSHTDIALGDYIKLVRHAERQVYDASMGLKVQTELDNARRQMQEHQHVDRDSVAAVVRYGQEWLAKIDGAEA